MVRFDRAHKSRPAHRGFLLRQERTIRELNDLVAAAENEIDRLNRRLDELKSSLGYRLGEPFRFLKRMRRSIRKRGLAANIRLILHEPMRRRRRVHWRRLAGIDKEIYRNWLAAYERLDADDRRWIETDIAARAYFTNQHAASACISGSDRRSSQVMMRAAEVILVRKKQPFFKPERLGEIALGVDIAGPATLFVTDKLSAIGGPAANAGAPSPVFLPRSIPCGKCC